MLWRTAIQIGNKDKPQGFDPLTQQAQVGDGIFWVNDDVNVDHQPYPAGGDTNTWCKVPLTGSERSDPVNLAVAGTVEFACALHPDEKGSVFVANAVDIGRGIAGAQFVPQAATVNQNESVVWNNSDSQGHQPAPDGKPPTTWFADPIGAGEVSGPIAFPNAGTVSYSCAVPGHTESGSIIVPHLVTIAAISGGTAAFVPGSLSVKLSDSVEWNNTDTQPHQPAPDSGKPADWFADPIPANTLSAAVVFSTAGSIPYHCVLHPTEKGTITVS